MRPILIIMLLALLGTSLTGCLYHPSHEQGNIITEKMFSQLKPGMTPEQVRYVLGTPLIEDSFHKERWDYYYSYQPGSDGDKKRLRHQRITIIFKNNRVDRIIRLPEKKS